MRNVRDPDKYGIFLAYVYLSNGKMLNEEIVKAGYAYIMTIPPNVKISRGFFKSVQGGQRKQTRLMEKSIFVSYKKGWGG